MKKLFSTLCIAGAAISMAACDTSGKGFRETAPYTAERTAGSAPGHSMSGNTKSKKDKMTGGDEQKMESAEPVFDKKMRK